MVYVLRVMQGYQLPRLVSFNTCGSCVLQRACQRLEAEVAAAQAAIGPHQTGGDGAAVAEDGVPAGAPPADTPVADGDTSVADGDTAAEEPQPVAGTSLG